MGKEIVKVVNRILSKEEKARVVRILIRQQIKISVQQYHYNKGQLLTSESEWSRNYHLNAMNTAKNEINIYKQILNDLGQ